MTDKQQERLKVSKNNWVRRTAGVKGTDKRRMEELREEVGVRESLKFSTFNPKWTEFRFCIDMNNREIVMLQLLVSQTSAAQALGFTTICRSTIFLNQRPFLILISLR